MTLEEFTEHWNMTEKQAYEYLRRHGCYIKETKSFCEKRIGEEHQKRLIATSPKKQNELNYIDIQKIYKLSNAHTSEHMRNIMFPLAVRKITRQGKCGHHMQVWNKKDVKDYFEGRLKPHPRLIKGYKADLIWFCTGRNWRLGDPVKTLVWHSKEV
jgi:hypothetical protein